MAALGRAGPAGARGRARPGAGERGVPGVWALLEATLQARRWDDARSVSVNVSGRQLDHPAFSLQVAEVLAMSGLDAGRLQLEITETAPLHERSLAGENLRELRSMGVSIVLDDFGTGWSSLEYLARFPVDAVKLDRGFVARVGREPRAALIVDAIVDLARRLDIEVVAEGVETGAQRDEVHAAGCSLAQGFFFGAPREAAELVGTYS